MPRTSEKTAAEKYLDALQRLEDAMVACERAATLIRKSYRTLKQVEVARNATDPPKPTA